MVKEIKVPSVGESISTGILAQWLKNEGDYVEEGEELFELETDKASVSVPSPSSGQLKIEISEGNEVSIGQKVGQIDTSVKASPEKALPEKAPPEKSPIQKTAAHQSSPSLPEKNEERPLSPAVKRIIKEEAVNPRDIKSTGRRNNITKEDTLKFLEARNVQVQSSQREIERVPMSRIRKKIAEKMVQARREAAHLTTFNEINMEKVMALRGRYKEQFLEKYGVKPGFNSFFVKACCAGLKEFPSVNSIIEGDDIIYHKYFDMGIAVSTDKGLVVPVIKNAGELSLPEIELSIAALAARARERKITPDELMGGTFSITNGGVFGSLLSTPIPNHPQAAILGMHAINKRPYVENDTITIKPVMFAALTYDHRIIDGKEAVGFLKRVKEFIEDPGRLLLEI